MVGDADVVQVDTAGFEGLAGGTLGIFEAGVDDQVGDGRAGCLELGFLQVLGRDFTGDV